MMQHYYVKYRSYSFLLQLGQLSPTLWPFSLPGSGTGPLNCPFALIAFNLEQFHSFFVSPDLDFFCVPLLTSCFVGHSSVWFCQLFPDD